MQKYESVDREELDIFLGHWLPKFDWYDYDEDSNEVMLDDEIYIPATDAGDWPIEIEEIVIYSNIEVLTYPGMFFLILLTPYQQDRDIFWNIQTPINTFCSR